MSIKDETCRWCGGEATAAGTDCICTVDTLQKKIEAITAKYERLLAAAKELATRNEDGSIQFNHAHLASLIFAIQEAEGEKETK